MYQSYYDAKKEKEKFCIDNNIAIYRLHDGWDRFQDFGIADKYAQIIGLPLKERDITSFYNVFNIDNKMTIKQVALKFANAFKDYGYDHVEVLGNPNLLVNKLTIGCGAISSLEEMMTSGANAVALADDGCTNWIEQQYCLDHDIAVILVHHSTNELAGIDGMKQYFENKYPNIEVVRLFEGYQYTVVCTTE